MPPNLLPPQQVAPPPYQPTPGMVPLNASGSRGSGVKLTTVLAIVAGCLAFVVAAVVVSRLVSDHVVTKRANCVGDAKTLKTAILAWNTEYLSGDGTKIATPYPTSVRQLQTGETDWLPEGFDTWVLRGGGNTVPYIEPADGRCNVNDISQIS